MQNSDDKSILQLWSRLVCEDELNEKDQEELGLAINSGGDLRNEISTDFACHNLLFTLHHEESLDDSAERFIQKTLECVSKPPVQTKTSTADSPAPFAVSIDSNRDTGLESLDSRERHNRVQLIRKQKRLIKSWNTITAAIAVAILVGLCFGIYLMRDNETPSIDKTADKERANEKPKSNIQLLKPNYLATLTSSQQAIWERPKKPGDRLEAGDLKLLQGTARMKLNSGAIIDVTAPSSIRLLSPNEITVKQGGFSADTSQGSADTPQGLVVNTPTARIVDMGTKYDLGVDESGVTDVYVREGELSARAINDHDEIQKWQLSSTGQNQAVFYEQVDDFPTSPIASSTLDKSGRFSGKISLQGEAVEFDRPNAFENARRIMMKQFQNSPANTAERWNEFVKFSDNDSKTSGSITINGTKFEFGSIEDAMELRPMPKKDIAEPDEPKKKTDPKTDPKKDTTFKSQSSFSGTISINGKVLKFKSKEEYEKAQRKLFGPAADFGAGNLNWERFLN